MALLAEPPWRMRAVRDVPVDATRSYVLYWMIGARRPDWNFALDRAIDWADALRKPLLVLEALRCDYQWASDRLHRFIIDGMCANARAFDRARIEYYPYLEPAPGAGHGLLRALAADAAVVVTDRTPVFDLPDLVGAAARAIDARLEEIDGFGIVPLDAPAGVFPTAFAFRRYLQRSLRDFLPVKPRTAAPARDRRLSGPLPESVTGRWPAASLVDGHRDLSRLPIEHGLAPAPLTGGVEAGRSALATFLSSRLPRYEERSHPDADVASGLSPYLHFGHISPHEVLARALATDDWSLERLGGDAAGRKEGWWGATPAVEAFVDQLVTWRELGANAARDATYGSYASVPLWARQTLDKHANDLRSHVYTLDQFASAATHDPVWNAAQRELAIDGRLHNYMRMLWGKKILEWTRSPQDAFAVMVELNNRYALDGRDPNSYSGITWVLGRYDRPWGPERAVFGTVRYMSSENATRKLRMTSYLRRYGPSRLF